MADAMVPYAPRSRRVPFDPVRRVLRLFGPGFSLRVLALTVGGSALLGVGAGFAWDQLAPHLEGTVVGRRAINPGEASAAYFGPEAWFVAITIVSGLLCALVLFAVVGTRGAGRLSGLLGLVLGAGAGSLVAWRVGYHLGPHSFRVAQVGSHATAGLALHAYGVLFCWPIAVVIVHFALTAGFGVDDSLAPDDPSPDGWAFDGLSRDERRGATAAD